MTLWNGVLWMGALGGGIYGSAVWLLHLGAFRETECGRKWETGLLGGLALGNAVIIMVIGQIEETMPVTFGESGMLYQGAEELLLGLVAGGLLAAAYMDTKSSYVYNYVWWWCLLWTVLLLCLPDNGSFAASKQWRILDGISIQQVISTVLFVILQQCLFARMYGRADSHAFSVCALVSCHWRGEMLWFLIHMLLAVTLLAIVQLAKGNITLQGRLRTPRPFVPYIIITFWWEILWMVFLWHRTTYIYA